MKQFPEDPSCRRVIAVLSVEDIEQSHYDSEVAKLITNDEVYVLGHPFRPEGPVPLAIQNLLDSNVISPGTVLVQSPFETDIYEKAAVAEDRFAFAKYSCFLELCQHLGACEATVEQVELHRTDEKGKTSVEFAVPQASGEVDIKDEHLKELTTKVIRYAKYPGGAPNIEEAEKLLRSRGLFGDYTMRSLLDRRRNSANPLLEDSLTLDLSSEAQDNLNVVAKLGVTAPNLLPIPVNLSVQHERSKKEERTYNLKVFVRFPE